MSPPLQYFFAPAEFYDVGSVAEEGAEVADEEVLTRAVREGRRIVTLDRDYGDLIYARRSAAPPAVVLFRLKSYRAEDSGRILAIIASSARIEGSLVTVEEGRPRRRPLPGR